jgi:hypothetical protein
MEEGITTITILEGITTITEATTAGEVEAVEEAAGEEGEAVGAETENILVITQSHHNL